MKKKIESMKMGFYLNLQVRPCSLFEPRLEGHICITPGTSKLAVRSRTSLKINIFGRSYAFQMLQPEWRRIQKTVMMCQRI